MGEVVELQRRTWTAGEDLTLRTAFLAGLTDAQIGLALDRSGASIAMRRHRLRMQREPLLSDREAIVEMAGQGSTVRRIAARRRLSEDTVRYVLRIAKIEPTEFGSYDGPNRRRAGR